MYASPRFVRALAAAIALLACVPATARAAAPTHQLTASTAFVAFDPFMVSIVENYRVRGLMILQVTLHVPDGKAQDDVNTLAPRLRDSYVRLLMEYGAKVATVNRPPDLGGIAAKLQSGTDGVIGAGKADVLITQALVRPLS